MPSSEIVLPVISRNGTHIDQHWKNITKIEQKKVGELDDYNCNFAFWRGLDGSIFDSSYKIKFLFLKFRIETTKKLAYGCINYHLSL